MGILTVLLLSSQLIKEYVIKVNYLSLTQGSYLATHGYSTTLFIISIPQEIVVLHEVIILIPCSEIAVLNERKSLTLSIFEQLYLCFQ